MDKELLLSCMRKSCKDFGDAMMSIAWFALLAAYFLCDEAEGDLVLALFALIHVIRACSYYRTAWRREPTP